MFSSLALSAALLLAPMPSTETTHTPDLFAQRTEVVMTGLKVPYKGKYYRKHQESYQLCVLRRESNGHWFSTNRSHGYFGAFQFNKALARGSTWMITPELKAIHGKEKGKAIAAKLRNTEMHKWKPYYQGMAFFTVLNWKGDWSGKKHWRGGRWHC
jgi:hypothetical protein